MVIITGTPAGTGEQYADALAEQYVLLVPGWFGGVLDGTSTSAWGRNFLDSHAVVGGWEEGQLARAS